MFVYIHNSVILVSLTIFNLNYIFYFFFKSLPILTNYYSIENLCLTNTNYSYLYINNRCLVQYTTERKIFIFYFTL